MFLGAIILDKPTNDILLVVILKTAWAFFYFLRKIQYL